MIKVRNRPLSTILVLSRKFWYLVLWYLGNIEILFLVESHLKPRGVKVYYLKYISTFAIMKEVSIYAENFTLYIEA